MEFIPEIKEALKNKGKDSLNELQKKIIPMIQEKKNVGMVSPTGSGKTLAYVIPILNDIKQNDGVKAIVIVPTRELAIQVRDVFREVGSIQSVSVSVLFGGTNTKSQKEVLSKNVSILVMTPGKASELLTQKKIKLDHLTHLVLDEADLLFQRDTKKDTLHILEAIQPLPQVILASATASNQIQSSIDTYVKEIEWTVIEEKQVPQIDQTFYWVEEKEKLNQLCSLIEEQQIHRAMIFCHTKKKANTLYHALNEIYPTILFHHDLDRDVRKKGLECLKEETPGLFITTDLASRGIDIKTLPCVIQYDAPLTVETYIHRIGRTGRNGNTGNSIVFFRKEESKLKEKIESILPGKVVNKTKKKKDTMGIKKKKKKKNDKNIAMRHKRKNQPPKK